MRFGSLVVVGSSWCFSRYVEEEAKVVIPPPEDDATRKKWSRKNELLVARESICDDVVISLDMDDGEVVGL